MGTPSGQLKRWKAIQCAWINLFWKFLPAWLNVVSAVDAAFFKSGAEWKATAGMFLKCATWWDNEHCLEFISGIN